MTAPSAQARRIAALVLLGAAFLVAYLGIVRPVLSLRDDTRAAIETNRDLLERYRRIAAGREHLKARLDRLERDTSVQRAYLSGDNDAVVAAQLQNRIKSIVQRAGGTLNSMQVLPPEAENGFRKISVRVKAVATMQAWVDTMLGIETGNPLLFLDNVDITTRSASRRVANRPAENVQLSVTFDVYGYLRSR
jgi:general secretion pathway protein M